MEYRTASNQHPFYRNDRRPSGGFSVVACGNTVGDKSFDAVNTAIATEAGTLGGVTVSVGITSQSQTAHFLWCGSTSNPAEKGGG